MTSIFLYALGVIIFVLAILISIGLHELGHMIPAKKFGAKVTQYFIGFGPTVWSFKKGETEYGIKAVPLGGYVKIVGMLPPAKDEIVTEDGLRIRKSNTGLFTQIISDARSVEYETISEEDYHRLFYRLPWYKKFVVMAGGPSVNIAIAFFCFLGLFSLYGNQEYAVDEKPVLNGVSQCLLPIDAYRDCEPTDELSPAAKAGLKKGDEIIAIDGMSIKTWSEFSETIATKTSGETTLTVVRKGEEKTFTVAPLVMEWPNKDGDIIERGVIGVSPTINETLVKGGPLYTVKWMGNQVETVAKSITSLPAKAGNVFLAIFGIENRDPNGPVSIVGGSRFAGETVAAEEQVLNPTEKIVYLVGLIGGFNLFIGFFNFLPILPLDGGHMAGAVWEGLRRRLAKLFRRADPGPVDIAKMLPVAQAFGYALFVLGIVLIIGDIVVPIKIT